MSWAGGVEEWLRVPWYAVANDLIGGWCVATGDLPPSCHNEDNGFVEIGSFFGEQIARHVAELHNTELEGA